MRPHFETLKSDHVSAENVLALTQHPAADPQHLPGASGFSSLTVSTSRLLLHSISTMAWLCDGVSPLAAFSKEQSINSVPCSLPHSVGKHRTPWLCKSRDLCFYILEVRSQSLFTHCIHIYVNTCKSFPLERFGLIFYVGRTKGPELWGFKSRATSFSPGPSYPGPVKLPGRPPGPHPLPWLPIIIPLGTYF